MASSFAIQSFRFVIQFWLNLNTSSGLPPFETEHGEPVLFSSKAIIIVLDERSCDLCVENIVYYMRTNFASEVPYLLYNESLSRSSRVYKKEKIKKYQELLDVKLIYPVSKDSSNKFQHNDRSQSPYLVIKDMNKIELIPYSEMEYFILNGRS